MKIEPVETRRLYLRGFTREDARFAISIWNDPKMGEYLPDPALEEIDPEYLKQIEGLGEDPECCYLISQEKGTGKRIGTCSFIPGKDGEAYDIAYCVHEQYWGRGFATEMAAGMIEYAKSQGARKITVSVNRDNAASNAVVKKLGFKAVGERTYRKRGTELVFTEYKYELILPQRQKPELLIPAGSLEVLKTAVIFGADAVYIGGEAFGLRAKAKNFSMEEMSEGIVFAHARGVKVYVTANILAHNSDLKAAGAYFEQLRDMKPERCDALIISDPGMFALAREVWPDVEIHISTQANNTNYRTYLFWHGLGAKRVVAARELSLEEIRQIRKAVPGDMEIECFVHGSMCISYSGRCLLSNYFTGRDANHGACTHPCRWKYAVVEETRPGEYMPVYENERGTFLFNSRDLCMVEHIPELAEAGIDSLKVEGRMKTALYIAAVTRTYRRAIDDYFMSEDIYRSHMDWYREEIAKCTYRQYSTGFFFGKPDANNQIYDNSTYVNEYVYLGTVEETQAGRVRIRQRNKFFAGEEIEVMRPDGTNDMAFVKAMYNGEGEAIESCPHAGQTVWLELSSQAGEYDLLRKRA